MAGNTSTMVGINVAFEERELRSLENMTGALGTDRARLGLARAVNRVTNTVHGRVIRAIVKQTSIPRRIVAGQVKKKLAAHKGSGPIQGIISATGKPISLKHFNPKQFKWGVRVKAWGEWQRYEGSFIFAGKWNSGKEAFQGHVMTRIGKARFPVKRENGPAVADGMIMGEAQKVFADTVREMLPRRAVHELSRLLNA